jgi:hypothetical protein
MILEALLDMLSSVTELDTRLLFPCIVCHRMGIASLGAFTCRPCSYIYIPLDFFVLTTEHKKHIHFRSVWTSGVIPLARGCERSTAASWFIQDVTSRLTPSGKAALSGVFRPQPKHVDFHTPGHLQRLTAIMSLYNLIVVPLSVISGLWIPCTLLCCIPWVQKQYVHISGAAPHLLTT